MLDQNTERMWFVISAVVAGAVIILITHGLFGNEIVSSLEARLYDSGAVVNENTTTNVSDEGYTENYTEDYTELGMMYGGINLARGTEGFLTSGGEEVQRYYTIDQYALSQMLGEQLTVSFKARNPEGSGGYGRHVFFSGDIGGVIEGSRSEDFELTENWSYHEFTFLLTEELYNNLMSVGEDTLEAGIKSNDFVAGNNGERYPVSVTEYQLELGSSATSYSK